MIESLADLLHPNDPTLLFDAVKAHQRLLLRSDRARQFAALAPWDRLNALITPEHIESGCVEMVRNSFIIASEVLLEHERGSQSKKRVQVGTLQSNCRQGLSLVINSIQDVMRDIALVNAIIERELRCPVHTNAYMSFSCDSAFKPHWDNHNVLVLQVHGRKQWTCWGQPWQFPTNKSECPVPSVLGKPEWEGLLEPGDILYVPRGDIHAAKVMESEDSVHLTITIKPPRGEAIGLAIARLCESETMARKDLPTLASAEDKKAWLAEMKAILHQAVDRLDLEQVLTDLDQKRAPLPFTSLGLINRVTLASRFQPTLRRRLPAGWNTDDGGTVQVGGKTWRLNAQEATVLENALRRHTLTVGELLPLMPHIEPDAIIRLVGDMALKGLLVMLSA